MEFDMPKGTCKLEGCDRPHSARGWCRNHYLRVQRTGEPGSAEMQIKRGRDAGCAVDGCDGQHFGHGYCQLHAYRLRTHGDPLIKLKPGLPGGPALWRGDDIMYQAAHRRVARMKGNAKLHTCVNCGLSANAWAYSHRSDTEFVCPRTGLRFSTNPDDYMPMCNTCHNRFDRGAIEYRDEWIMA